MARAAVIGLATSLDGSLDGGRADDAAVSDQHNEGWGHVQHYKARYRLHGHHCALFRWHETEESQASRQVEPDVQTRPRTVGPVRFTRLLPQLGDLDVLEPDFHGRADVDLQGNDALFVKLGHRSDR